MASNSSKGTLVRSIGFMGVVLLVISSMIGSGVFKKVSGMSADLGSPSWVLLAWVAAGLITLLGALSNAEAASMYPEAGGQYVYFKHMYGRFFAFLYGWSTFTVIQSATIAGIGFVFAESLNYFLQLPELSNSLPAGMAEWGLTGDFAMQPFGNLTVKLLAIVLIWGLVAINWFGVKLGNLVSNVLATAIILSIATIMLMCFGFSDGSFANLSHVPDGPAPYDLVTGDTPARGWFAAFFGALLAAFWAYEGWLTIGFLGGEIRDADRNLPRGLVMGSLVVTIVYCLVHVAYLYAMPIEQVAGLKAIPNSIAAVEILRSFTGGAGVMFLSVLILFSTFNATNASVIAAPRVYYALAKDGLFFQSAAKVHDKYHTPYVALLMQGGWATVLVMSGSFDTLTNMLIFAAFIFYGAGAFGVVVLRRKQPDTPRPYKVPLYPVIPIMFTIFSAVLVVQTIWDQPALAGVGLLLILSGVPFYFYWNGKVRP